MDPQFQCRHFLSAAHLLRTDDDVSPVQIDLLKDLALSYDEKLYKCEDLTSIKMRIEDVARSHFDDLYTHFPLETSHAIATTNAADFSRHTPTDTRQLVYGEIDFASFSEVLRVAMRRLRSRNKFVDLGHGIGKAVLAAVFVADFKEYHGVEILQGLHDTSNLILEQFNQHIMPLLTKSTPRISLQCGSFLSPEISATWPLGGGISPRVKYVSDWTDADVVFANSTCFPSPLMRQIETMCRDMKPGSRVITFTTGLSSEYFKIIFKKQLFMSWGPATVYIHERLSDSEVKAGTVDRVELLSPRYRKWANPSPFADKKPPAAPNSYEEGQRNGSGSLHVEVSSECDDTQAERGGKEWRERDDVGKMSTATTRAYTRPTLMGKAHIRTARDGPGSRSSDSTVTPFTSSSTSPTSPPYGHVFSPPGTVCQSGSSKRDGGGGPGESSMWDPDTPTLKSWAREQLLASQSELLQLQKSEANNGISSDSDDDFSSTSSSCGPQEAFNKTGGWQRGSTSIDISTSSDEEDLDNTDMDFRQMNIDRFAYYNNGKIQGDSSSDDGDDDSADSGSDSDIDNDVISANLENYYHVKDDSDEDAEEEDDVDEIYDDSS